MKKIDLIKNKIIHRDQLAQNLLLWRFLGKKIVFTNGCFDIIHAGHITYLSEAADLGNILIIGLNTDNSVKRLKGEGRPLNHEDARALVLASLKVVTCVILFDEDTPYNLISEIRPDFLVKGKDYKVHEIAGNDLVQSYGGQVVTIDLVDGYSTTGLIGKMNTGEQCCP